MSTEKEKLDKLVERIDELIMVLGKISEDLKDATNSIKKTAAAQQGAQPAPQAPAQAARAAPAKKPADDVRTAFPQDLEHMLTFEDKGEYIMIKPKQFLGSENFAKIASAVRGLGGEYISAGRDSHFRVYKKQP